GRGREPSVGDADHPWVDTVARRVEGGKKRSENTVAVGRPERDRFENRLLHVAEPLGHFHGSRFAAPLQGCEIGIGAVAEEIKERSGWRPERQRRVGVDRIAGHKAPESETGNGAQQDHGLPDQMAKEPKWILPFEENPGFGLREAIENLGLVPAIAWIARKRKERADGRKRAQWMRQAGKWRRRHVIPRGCADGLLPR